MEKPLIDFLVSHFWFTVISVGGIVFVLLNAYIVHRKQSKTEQDGFFTVAGQELDAICSEIDGRGNTPVKNYKREERKYDK